MPTRVLDLAQVRPQVFPDATAEEDDALQRLHKRLVASLDLSVAVTMPRDKLRAELRAELERRVPTLGVPVTAAHRKEVVEGLLDEILGYGPIEKLLRQDDVSDVLVNGPHAVWVERHGKLERTDVTFRDDEHLLHVINRIVAPVGRRIDESNPLVDARLPDGSRVHAAIAPVALDGPALSIRRFGRNPILRGDLIALGTAPAELLDVLEVFVRARLNLLVSGGTGSGKTTLLNVLSSAIPEDERIVTIEDAAELRLQQPHVVRMETRQANVEGQGAITTRVLVRNALRMRPDRIIVGEIRGDEAIDMLQAMNSGHEGSIGTIHANSARHVLGRLQAMVGLGLGEMPEHIVWQMIADAIDVIVQIKRFPDGVRRIVSLTEVERRSDGGLHTIELFRFRTERMDEDGSVHGVFESLGAEPTFLDRLVAAGLTLPADARDLRVEV